MASKAAAQIRQGSVGLGQRQEEEKERRWDKCKAKEKEERGRKSTEAGGPTTNCNGRPSLSKGGTHRATGPVIIVVFKKVGSTAFTREALLCEASFRKDLRFRFGDRGMRVCQCLLLPIKN